MRAIGTGAGASEGARDQIRALPTTSMSSTLARGLARDLAHYLDWCQRFVGDGAALLRELDELRSRLGIATAQMLAKHAQDRAPGEADDEKQSLAKARLAGESAANTARSQRASPTARRLASDQDELEPPPFLDRRPSTGSGQAAGPIAAPGNGDRVAGASDDRLAKPLASPVSSVHVDRAALTEKLAVPGAGPPARPDTRLPVGEIALVAAVRRGEFPNKAAVAGNVPDELIIERHGRFFFYNHAGEIVDAAARKRIETLPVAAPTAKGGLDARPSASAAE